ncbi:hypothetical protein JCM16303_004076 [Sporobolomyces ruberrimus]
MAVNRVARLPDELAIEIFKNRVLTAGDLASCALVSRRFTDPVREPLYESVEVVVMEDLGRSAEDEDSDEQEEEEELLETAYWTASFRLLNTLMGNARLAELVKKLQVTVEASYDSRHYPDHSAVATTPIQALSTFLRLAPQIKHVMLNGPFPDKLDVLQKLVRHKNIEGLCLRVAGDAEVDFIARELGHLRQLEVSHLRTDTSTRLPEYPANLNTLTVLNCRPSLLLPLLFTNSSTLRSLSIDINAALSVTYSEYPQISDLTLNCRCVETDPPRDRRKLFAIQHQFWRSLCDSPSLVTLSFKSRDPLPNDDFTSIFYSGSRCPYKPIPTLRTVRFIDYTFLDRVQLILSSALAQTLYRIILPYTWTLEAAYGGDMKTRAVVGMCEESGIQVCAGPYQSSFHHYYH